MSTLDKNMETMVLNYSQSPIAITTRDNQYLIPGSVDGVPAEFPLTVSEIIYINSVSDIFKAGYLWFDPALEEDLYAALRITDWRSILRDEEIDDMILHPMTAGLQKLISIQRPRSFERVYGRYIGMKNAGYPIAGGVDKVMGLRRKEFQDGKVVSEIQISSAAPIEARQDETRKQIEELEKRIAELTAQVAASKDSVPAVSEQKPAAAKATGSKSTKGTKTKET